MEQVSSTQSLLRPHQVVEMEAERSGLERSLQDPATKDRPLVRKRLGQLNKMMEAQAPQELVGPELDLAVKEADELLEKITDGMLTQEEMRKNPAGAVGHQVKWEKANKERIARWKNLMLRLNIGSTDPDIANLERHRPVRRSSSFNMDTVQIPGKAIFLPPGDIKSKNRMSDEDRSALNLATAKTVAQADSKLNLDSKKTSKRST